jgi:hypothetical protein
MATRLPGLQRAGEELRSLIEGQLSTAAGKDELIKFVTRLIVFEGEADDVVGRDYYARRAPRYSTPHRASATPNSPMPPSPPFASSYEAGRASPDQRPPCPLRPRRRLPEPRRVRHGAPLSAERL